MADDWLDLIVPIVDLGVLEEKWDDGCSKTALSQGFLFRFFFTNRGGYITQCVSLRSLSLSFLIINPCLFNRKLKKTRSVIKINSFCLMSVSLIVVLSVINLLSSCQVQPLQ